MNKRLYSHQVFFSGCEVRKDLEKIRDDSVR